MYIVTQDGSQIVNSDCVIKFYIDITPIFILGDPDDYEMAALMADTLKKDIYAETRIVKALGHYNSKETAQQILKLLLDALQDGADTFYMPPP